MRLLPILCCLVASASCFSIDGLKGKELWKTVSDMSPEDVDEVARIIAENSGKVGDRVMMEHAAIYAQNRLAINKAKEHVQELKESMRPIPGGLPPSITEINKRSGLEEVLIEGDIVMTPDEARNYFKLDSEGRRSKRQAYQSQYEFPKSLWKDGMYYNFHPQLNQEARDVVHAAVGFWQENTCLEFHETKDPSKAPVKPVVEFFPGRGCNSRIGRNPYGVATQTINLQPNYCEDFSVAAHEIAHALGFMHEQSRWDRDQYLTLDLSKVEPNMTHNYNKYDEKENDNYGKQYDYGGVMHYEENFFAKNKDDTVMYAKNPDYQLSLGGAIGPMFGDVYEMNMLYSCYDRCKNSGTVCQNEGMPNPNNCRVCQCPSGFGGNDCSEREAPSHGLTCGETLAAGADWKTLESTGVVGAGNYNSRDGNHSDPYRCTWHITAPAGKVIEYEVTFVGVKRQRDDILCTNVCYFGGLKIKGQEKTWKPEGMKLCCSKQLNKIRTTVSNLLVIDAYNHFIYTDFSLQYRIKDAGQPPVSTKSTTKSTKTTTTTTTTRRTTTTTPHVPSSGCPAGYDILSSTGTMCYSINVTQESYLNAYRSCQSTGGFISIYQTRADEDTLKNAFIRKASGTGTTSYWRGSSKDGKCGIYDFRLNAYTYTECYDQSRYALKAGYICQINTAKPVTTPPTKKTSTTTTTTTTTTTPRVPSSGCPAGYDVLSSARTMCYNVNVSPKNYVDAYLACYQSGGSISLFQSLTDEDKLKNAFIRKASGTSTTSYWRGSNNGKCGIYDFRLNAYTYTNCNDRSANALTAGYICQIKLGKPVTTPSTTTTTTSPGKPTVSVIYYDNYILGLTPMPFATANGICQALNAHLVSLHQTGVGEQLQSIYNQNKPGLSSYWIGLHKNQGISSQYSWVDGSPMDYKNWSPGYPGSSAAEKCGAYANGEWIALNCNQALPFACEM